MPLVTLRELVEGGMHFGHRASRWNPKMEPYIFGKRNLIHIIDLRETVRGIVRAAKLIEHVTSEGGDVLFVGTKRQARNTVQNEARRCKMHYVSERWIGGTLTNFETVRSRLRRLAELEELERSGEMGAYSKKMASTLRREKRKIDRNLAGIRDMQRLPRVVVIVDPRREKIAVAEAKRLGIPRVCLSDTDADPDWADVLIPGNDDALRSIEIVCAKLADAAIVGRKRRVSVTQTPKRAAEKAAAGERGAARKGEAKESAPDKKAEPEVPATAAAEATQEEASEPAAAAEAPAQTAKHQFGEGILPSEDSNEAEARSAKK